MRTHSAIAGGIANAQNSASSISGRKIAATGASQRTVGQSPSF
jgi:hypothetical protein